MDDNIERRTEVHEHTTSDNGANSSGLWVIIGILVAVALIWFIYAANRPAPKVAPSTNTTTNNTTSLYPTSTTTATTTTTVSPTASASVTVTP